MKCCVTLYALFSADRKKSGKNKLSSANFCRRFIRYATSRWRKSKAAPPDDDDKSERSQAVLDKFVFTTSRRRSYQQALVNPVALGESVDNGTGRVGVGSKLIQPETLWIAATSHGHNRQPRCEIYDATPSCVGALVASDGPSGARLQPRSVVTGSKANDVVNVPTIVKTASNSDYYSASRMSDDRSPSENVIVYRVCASGHPTTRNLNIDLTIQSSRQLPLKSEFTSAVSANIARRANVLNSVRSTAVVVKSGADRGHIADRMATRDDERKSTFDRVNALNQKQPFSSSPAAIKQGSATGASSSLWNNYLCDEGRSNLNFSCRPTDNEHDDDDVRVCRHDDEDNVSDVSSVSTRCVVNGSSSEMESVTVIGYFCDQMRRSGETPPQPRHSTPMTAVAAQGCVDVTGRQQPFQTSREIVRTGRGRKTSSREGWTNCRRHEVVVNNKDCNKVCTSFAPGSGTETTKPFDRDVERWQHLPQIERKTCIGRLTTTPTTKTRPIALLQRLSRRRIDRHGSTVTNSGGICAVEQNPTPLVRPLEHGDQFDHCGRNRQSNDFLCCQDDDGLRSPNNRYLQSGSRAVYIVNKSPVPDFLPTALSCHSHSAFSTPHQTPSPDARWRYRRPTDADVCRCGSAGERPVGGTTDLPRNAAAAATDVETDSRRYNIQFSVFVDSTNLASADTAAAPPLRFDVQRTNPMDHASRSPTSTHRDRETMDVLELRMLAVV